MTQRFLVRAKNPSVKAFEVFSIDMEYTRKDGIFLEAAIGHEDSVEFYASMPDLIEAMFALVKRFKREKKRVRFVCHAGNIAEFSHIIHFLRNDQHYRKALEIDLVCSGVHVVGMKLKRKKDVVEIHDFFAHIPKSLKKITESLCTTYKKLSSSVDFYERDYIPVQDRDYLKHDVLSLYEAYTKLNQIAIEAFGVSLSMTAGGTSIRAFQQNIQPGHVYYQLSREAEDFCRNAYFGGYCHPGRDNDIHEHIVSLDANAAYGYQMLKHEFPDGKPVWTDEYIYGKRGIYHVRATSKEDRIVPYVPVRIQHELRYLGRKVETCETYLTAEEIQFCRERGYEIEIIEGLYWQRSFPIFRAFMEKVYEIEKRGGMLKECAKLMRNSLYGKFGMRREAKHFIVTDEPPENSYCYIDVDTGKIVEDVYMIDEEIDEPYIHPEWAAYITAYQRLYLFEWIERIGVDCFYGSDTDSIKTTKERAFELGLSFNAKEWGDFKIEAEFLVFRSHAPKNYSYITEEHEKKMKAKGIPQKSLQQEMIDDFLYRKKKQAIYFESVTSALTMLKSDGKKSFTQRRHRTLTNASSQAWELIDGCFLPARIEV